MSDSTASAAASSSCCRSGPALGSPSDLVLLDEPGNNMDPAALATLEALLQDGGARGVLVISHDQRLLRRVCTRLVDLAA
jgi:ABC-2 type transport system ATP-binding protein